MAYLLVDHASVRNHHLHHTQTPNLTLLFLDHVELKPFKPWYG